VDRFDRFEGPVWWLSIWKGKKVSLNKDLGMNIISEFWNTRSCVFQLMRCISNGITYVNVLFLEKRWLKEVVSWAEIRRIFPIKPMLFGNHMRIWYYFLAICCISPFFCQKSRNFKNWVICMLCKFSVQGKMYRK